HFGPDTVIAQIASPSFDATTFEVWGALLGGGRLAIVERDVLLSPADLAARFALERVTAMFMTVALFNQMVREAPRAFAGVRDLLVGGEALDPASVAALLAGAPPRRLLNGYGPTETTTFAAWH